MSTILRSVQSTAIVDSVLSVSQALFTLTPVDDFVVVSPDIITLTSAQILMSVYKYYAVNNRKQIKPKLKWQLINETWEIT